MGKISCHTFKHFLTDSSKFDQLQPNRENVFGMNTYSSGFKLYFWVRIVGFIGFIATVQCGREH